MEAFATLALTVTAKKALDLAFDRVKHLLDKHKATLLTPKSEIERAVDEHQQEIKRWASEISFKDFPSGKAMVDVFVPLVIYADRIRSRGEGEALLERPLEEALGTDEQSCIVLGQPGAGKTTALKHICHRFLDDPDFLERFSIVIRIQLRELNTALNTNSPEYFCRAIQELLRLRIGYPKDLEGEENASIRRSVRDKLILDWLNGARALVILDGFDEITLKAKRDLFVEELRRVAPQLTEAAFVLTARSGEFSVHIENTKLFEIKPLNEAQIEAFVSSWLGPEHGLLFMRQLSGSPFRDTAIRPLTLAHLCVIYDRIKRIPEKPKVVYRKIVHLLLDEWDEQRSVIRKSAYANFDADRKAEFLANLSYDLTVRLKTTSFSRDGLLETYGDIHENFGLPATEASKVVDELETHTGLFFQSGRDEFEFSHKSLQEYLAADYIVKLPKIPSNMVELQTMPNEIALATAISSRPSEYLTELVNVHFGKIRTSFQFTRSFVSRLLLEDPDFENTPRVGYALLVLYSRYLNSVIREEAQLSLFVMDQLGTDFAVLANKIKQRITLTDLLRSYKKIETSHTFDGDPVWHLKKKRQKQGTLRPSAESLLPEELWVRDSLLAESSSGASDSKTKSVEVAV